MKKHFISLFFCVSFIFYLRTDVSAQKNTDMVIKELQQLYRIELLPQYRKDSKVYLISTYDTTGGNDDGFSGKYSFIRKEGNNEVLADLKGPGVVERIHSPTPSDKMIAFYFDGEKTPRIRMPFIELFSGKHAPFLPPLVGNEVGGYYCYVPILYKKSLKIVYEGDDEKFHQIQYRTLPKDTQVESFTPSFTDGENHELNKVAEVWGKVGKPYWLSEDQAAVVKKKEVRFELQPDGKVEIFQQNTGGRILGIEIDRDKVNWEQGVVLEAHWDKEKVPAIYSPANDFFGYFFGKVSAQSLLLGSFSGHDYCYLPMPFDHSATLSLKALPGMDEKVTGTARIYYSSNPRDKGKEGKLYTVWRRETNPATGKPYLLFDARGRGHHVATILQAQGLIAGTTEFFEGDDVSTVDGEMRCHGGGSEDYFNGGWYWILDRWDKGISLPIHGSLGFSVPFERTGGYRFYLEDKASFENHYHLTIEHGPEGNKSPVDYTSLCFYYGEQASASAVDPANFTKLPAIPKDHEYYAQDFSMRLWWGTTTRFTDDGLEISGAIPTKGRALDDAERSAAKGRVRIDLSEMPSGRYRLYVIYDQFPNGGDFSIWRRQEKISDWIDTYSPTEQSVEKKLFVGEVQLTDQIRTVTIRTQANEQGEGVFRIKKLILEDIQSQ